MATLNDIVILPIAKEDFEKLNEIAEALICFKHPSKKAQINAVRKFVLYQFQKFQSEQIWLADLEDDIDNNLYVPKLLRRHSI
jgi:hypothetical protein